MNENFIILNFPKFAGGKFISNCLSLSRHCCPQNLITARHLLTNPEDYEYRFHAIMSTLPSTTVDMKNWISHYEFGDQQFYGPSVVQWQFGISRAPEDLIKTLLTANFRMFLVAHNGDVAVRNLLKVWPGSSVIKLINYTKFSEISRQLKSSDKSPLDNYAGNYCKQKYTELAGVSWPSWEQFESVGYNIRLLPNYSDIADEVVQFYNWDGIDNNSVLFDIDNSIFDEVSFIENMKKLYGYFEFDDFNLDLIRQFWQAYISLHIDS